MDFVEYLNKILEVGNVVIVAVPAAAAAFAWLVAKLGKAYPVIKQLVQSVKDGKVSDTEMATACWMLLAILVGFWPNKSLFILKFAPDTQIKKLVAEKFITQEQADSLKEK